MLGKSLLTDFDHGWCSASIDLIAGQIMEILEDGLVDETGAALPLIFRLGVGQHRNEGEIRMLLRPLGRHGRHIQILQGPGAPVQHHFAVDVRVDGVLDHRFDRRETGAAGHENYGLVGVFAQEERT